MQQKRCRTTAEPPKSPNPGPCNKINFTSRYLGWKRLGRHM